MSSDKSKKAGRNSKKPSHLKYLAEHREIKNKMRREIANLKRMPDDKACLARLQGYLTKEAGNLFVIGMVEQVSEAVNIGIRHNMKKMGVKLNKEVGPSCAA